MTGAQLGIYVHVPFCAERCDYCAFVTTTGNDHLHQRYAEALVAEATRVGQPAPATSVFFGGGTPSRLEVEQVALVLGALDRAPHCEVTLEMNPEDATPPKVAGLVAAGVTRLSVGLQSTSGRVLAELGRVHRGDSVRQIARVMASAGLASWSVDLIVGARVETDDDLRRSIADVLDHDDAPPHLSCYLLSAERGTPLGRDPRRHPDDDVLAARYEILDEELQRRGYQWYEVSNWSRPGHECRHNTLYWHHGDYVGLGVAAHGHHAGTRRWNVGNLDTYLERVESGADPVLGTEILDADQRAFERLALALRTRRGIPRAHLGADAAADGLVVEEEGRWVLTLKGRLLADEVARRLIVGDGAATFGR